MGIGLVVVAGVEQPDPGGELRRDVDDVFAVLEEPLRERASETLDTYSHLWPDNDERTRAAVDGVLRNFADYLRTEGGAETHHRRSEA